MHVLDHFSRLLFAPLSGLLQCQTLCHGRHPSSPLSTKLFRRLLKFQSLRLKPAPLLAPTWSVSKRQGGKKTLKLPTLQILLCAVVTHSLLSVQVCLGLAIFCVLKCVKAGQPFLTVQVHYVGYRLRWLVWYLENGPRLRLGPFSRYQTATSDDILYIRAILYSKKFSSEIYFRRFCQRKFLTKLSSWLTFFTNHNHGIRYRTIHECEGKRWGKERQKKYNDWRANKWRPAFDENKFLTNCLTVIFDEAFRWRKFPAICTWIDDVFEWAFLPPPSVSTDILCFGGTA